MSAFYIRFAYIDMKTELYRPFDMLNETNGGHIRVINTNLHAVVLFDVATDMNKPGSVA